MRAINSEHWNIPKNISTPAEFATRHARHALSRRVFMTSVAATAAVGLVPRSVLAKKPSSAAPQPTTNTTTVAGVAFHFTPFEPAGIDPSSIADFSGLVGVAQVQGKGTGTSPDQRPEPLLYDTDMRFMRSS